MPEIAEPPTKAAPEYVPPQAPPEKEPLKVKAGDIWKQEFEKLKKAEVEGKPAETPTESVTSTPAKKDVVTTEVVESKEVKPDVQQVEKAIEKHASPLDVVTSETEVKEEPDVLKEFDEKNANWKRAREVMREQSQKLKEFETKLSEFEKTPKAQPEEILALAKERDELKSKYERQEESLKALNYQYSETFQNMVKERDNHVQKIQARVERLGGNTDQFMAALSMPDGRAKNAAIKEALADVDTEDRTRIHTLLETLDEKNEKLAEEAKNSSSRWDELQTKRNAELAEEQAKGLKSIETTFSQIAASIPEKIPTLRTVPDNVEGAADWNTAIKTAQEEALRVLTPGGSDAEESMETAIMGRHYKFLMQYVLKQGATIKEQAKRLAEYDSGGPDFKGGDKPKTDVKLAPSEKYHKALAQLKSTED